jgi:HAD superfamily hydrolase (TIGR01509 family)
MIKYAVFDMDGTLLDTERLFKSTWIETSDKWGIDDSRDFYKDVCGRNIPKIREVFLERYGDKYDFDKFLNERNNLFVEIIKRDGVPVKEGCFELLEYLKSEGIPCALATSTPMRLVEHNMSVTGIGKYMDAIVTGDMVENGKPAPDIFIEAGRRIGAVPSECMVLEDSYNGLRGASAAGMIPIMIIDELLPNDEMMNITRAQCNTLYEVLETIKKINSGEI